MKKSGFILPLLITVLFLIGAGVGYYFASNNLGLFKKNIPTHETFRKMFSDENGEDTFLIDHIPNFDTLALTDLPNFDDVRSVFDYRGNKLIVGYDKIVEYDIRNNTYVRVNKALPDEAIYSGAKEGDFLYITTQGREYSGSDKDWRRLLKIDLMSGKIVKTFFGKTTDPHYTNLNALSFGNSIWVSSWDGIMKIDPADDSMVFYPASDIGLSQCLGGLYTVDGLLKVKLEVSMVCGREDHSAVYNPSSNSWTETYVPVHEYSSLINKNLTDFELPLPRYFSVSNLLNGKYYLTADKGIYTLSKNQLPKMIKPIMTEPHFWSYIDSEEKKLLVLDYSREYLSGDPFLEDFLFAEIIDLTSGKITDLVKKHPYYHRKLTNEQIHKLEKFMGSELRSDGDVIELVSILDGGTAIFQVDMKTQMLTLP